MMAQMGAQEDRCDASATSAPVRSDAAWLEVPAPRVLDPEEVPADVLELDDAFPLAGEPLVIGAVDGVVVDDGSTMLSNEVEVPELQLTAPPPTAVQVSPDTWMSSEG